MWQRKGDKEGIRRKAVNEEISEKGRKNRNRITNIFMNWLNI